MSNTIAENLQRLKDAKTDIATAITNKGGTVNTGDGFEDFPADIATIPDAPAATLGVGVAKTCIQLFEDVWADKTWSGLTSIDGDNIWTDGDNIYYSSSSTQYVLDKATSTWTTKTWNGLTSFDGSRVWTDGDIIYYSTWRIGAMVNTSGTQP